MAMANTLASGLFYQNVYINIYINIVLIEVRRDFSVELEVTISILQNYIFQDNFCLVTLNKRSSG